jgi:CHAT domain
MGSFFGSASLVFLAACRSACACGRPEKRCTCFGPAGASAKIMSMADAVLAAGVTHVVATALNLVEEIALKVEATFYRVLLSGGTVAAAFRAAASVLPLKGEGEPSRMYLLPQDSAVHNVRMRGRVRIPLAITVGTRVQVPLFDLAPRTEDSPFVRVYFSGNVVPDELRGAAADILANGWKVGNVFPRMTYEVVTALGGTAIGLGEKCCWVSVTGPRGAGKSTLAAAAARYINLRLPADLGRVLWVDVCGARSVAEVAHEVLSEMRRVVRGEHGPVAWDHPDDALCVAFAECMRGGLLVLDDCDVAWRCHEDASKHRT